MQFSDSFKSSAGEHPADRWKNIGLLLGVLSVFFVLLEILHPYYWLQADNRDSYLPFFIHNWHAVAQGKFALFNFFQNLGTPHFSVGQTAVFYPPVYAAAALSLLFSGQLYWTMDIFAVLHLLAGAAGMFLLLRRLQNENAASLAGAVSWALSGFAMVTSCNSIISLPLIAFFPFMLFYCLRLNSDGKGLWPLVAARLLFFYAGYINYFAYACLF